MLASQKGRNLPVLLALAAITLSLHSRNFLVESSSLTPQVFGCRNRRNRRPAPSLDGTTALFQIPRGGGSSSSSNEKKQIYYPLAQALLPHLVTDSRPDSYDMDDITVDHVAQALVALAASQQTFKGLDGVAHEAYQRTHTKEDISLHVSGRAMRTVARTQAVANGLGACELCELVVSSTLTELSAPQNPSSATNETRREALLRLFPNGTLVDKEVLVDETITVKYQKTSLDVRVLVLYQPDYRGGAGIEHGSLFGEIPSKMYRGRILIVLGTADTSVDDMLLVLGLPAQLVPLQSAGQHEAASVQPLLYRAASQVLHRVETALAPYDSSAIHIVGHSLGGGVATLLASMLEGHIAASKAGSHKQHKRKGRKKHSNTTTTKTASQTANTTDLANMSNNTSTAVGSGWGKGRTSAVVLGAPPSLSANVPVDTLVTSIVYGDDWVSRTTEESLKRLLARVQPILKRRKSILTKQAALFTDTLKLATQGLTAHAHGREGEECRLTGSSGSQAYLLRPRRYGNHVSIHEMGRASGREAIRAAVLWQLSDILLSPSYSKHHSLASYIDGLDRVHVRGLDDGRPSGEEERNGLEEWEAKESSAQSREEEDIEEDEEEEEEEDEEDLQAA